jgi:hypothetical protein
LKLKSVFNGENETLHRLNETAQGAPPVEIAAAVTLNDTAIAL